MLPRVDFARRVIVAALGLSALLAGLACRNTEPENMMEDQAEPIDVQAIVWCVFSFGSGETADGEEIRDPITGGTEANACLCLPIEIQPFSGSELDEILHQMAIDKCEESLREQGAVTTNCEELVGLPVDYETICDPDDWPPPPI